MNKIAVIDNGTGECKAGILGQCVQLPTATLQCAVGRPKDKQCIVGAKKKDYYVGNELTQFRGVLKITYPIEHGIINSYEDMTVLWAHLFQNELRVNPSEISAILTEAPYNPSDNREKMVETMFEKFSLNNIYVAIQAVLALYATGRTTGLILDIGDGVTHTVPIYESYSIAHAITRLNLAGRDVTQYLTRLLTENNYHAVSSSEKEIVKDIKEKLSYVSLNYESDIQASNKSKADFIKHYQLPDGNIITIDDQLFRCTELLFRPLLNGIDCKGTHHLLYHSIQTCDVDIRRSMYENIIISGGTTVTTGFAERLEKEMYFLTPPKIQSQIVALPNRKYLVFEGGLALASMEGLKDKWISKTEYEEVGPRIVHMKCL